jgi:nucleoid-associated protein YgaU
VARRIGAPSAARSEQLVRTVKFGDSLWTMAEDVYGYVNPNVLRRVQDANPHIRNINVLAPGQDVVFPRVPEAPSDPGLALYGSMPPSGGN